MRFYANWLSFAAQCADAGEKLSTDKTYVVTVEEVGKSEAIRRLFFAYRDRYADRVGPRDRDACTALLKRKYGPQVPYGRIQINPINVKAEFMVDPNWVMPRRPGRFFQYRENGDERILFLVSTGDYDSSEYLELIEGIKDELTENGIGFDDLAGGGT